MKIKQIIRLQNVVSVKSLAVALILGSTVSLSADAYTLVDLGANVVPKAMNNSGVVVGSNNTDQYPATAFSWTLDSGFTAISGGTSANTVNDSGLIAGNTVDGAFIGSRDWSNYGAFGINSVGEVAGYKVGTNPYQPRSLPYNPAIFNGKKWEVYDIARLYSRGTRKGVYADRFILNALNLNGFAVGYKYRYGLAGSSAILIDTNGPVNDVTDVVFLPGERAVDINNNNIAAGITRGNSRTTPPTYSQALTYDNNTDTLVILPVLEGGLRSSALDINENNQVAGSSESANGNHAVIWDEFGDIVDLNDIINAPGWVLTSANAITDNGEVAGVGTFNGATHAFVLLNGAIAQPPVPNNPPAQNEAPKAVAKSDKESGKAPLMVSFDSSESSDPDGSITAYSWDFMDGNTSTEATPSHEFTVTGKYLVTLTVTDDLGSTDSTEVEITVKKGK